MLHVLNKMDHMKEKINWLDCYHHEKDDVKTIKTIQLCKLVENLNRDKRIIYSKMQFS